METSNNDQWLKIGKGRSGTVFRTSDDEGRELAVKVFSGEDGLTKLVNYLITGAPNAYSWNEDAVRCAHLRRELLTIFMPFWVGDRARIAKSYGTSWNEEALAYELKTEFIKGRQAALHHPFSEDTDSELKDLVGNVMEPLQKKLIESGFDGLVWQAGKGNPIALNNFLVDENSTWVWIDAESGVPALFPLNPLALLFFYLPKSVKHRRALFDDVDTQKLYNYLQKNQEDIKIKLGAEQYAKLVGLTAQLEKHQQQWKSVKRAKRGIIYQLKKQKITQAQADWYSKHILLWYGKEFLLLLKRALVKLFWKLPVKLFKLLISINYWQALKNFVRFTFIGKYRKTIAENYLKQQVTNWEERQQLNKRQSDFLRDQIEHESTSPYLADFIILMGLKPLTNIIEWVVIPTLYATGVINEVALAAGVTMGGMVYRTLYTIGRMLYERIKFGREHVHPRWVALFVGLIPTAGNAAYPIQIIYSASSKSREVAEFLTYSIGAGIGARIPIWGGKDTRTEHFFNHISDIIIRKRRKLVNRGIEFSGE